MKRSPSSPKRASSRKPRPKKANILPTVTTAVALAVAASMVPTVQQWFPVMKPPPRLTVSQWADANRQLSAEASAEPGKWDTSRAEYQRGIMDSVSDPLVDHTVVMKSAQVGWTEIINNIAGYFVDQDPAPMLVLQPTLAMGEAWSKDRLSPMIRDTPCLTSKVADSKSRDSGNTILHKKFAGGHLTIAGANSPASLASRPIRVVLADEIDRYPASAGLEGDPLSLAHKRANNFWNRRKLSGSTPTVAGASRIEAAWELSDKRRFFVPCPACGTCQVLTWQQVKWDKGEDGQHLYLTAYYECAHCEHHFDDGERWAAVRLGEWRATAPFHGVAGFHIWEAYSPWVKLADTVKAFLDAKSHPEAFKVWVNTALGEPFVEKGEAPDWQRLYERRTQELRLGEVPEWAGALTCGADVQRNRIEADVWAWGPGLESSLVDHRVFHGDPCGDEIWKELDGFLREEWETATGRRLRMSRVAIDTGDGFSTTHVYGWARRHPREVMAIKGSSSFSASSPVMGPNWVDVTVRGRKIERGVQLWTVATALFKSETYSWLQLDQPLDGQAYPNGYIHLPQGVEAEWIQQLVAEQLVTVKNKRTGFTKREWQKTRDRNEAIDMRVYARAAAYAVGLDRWSKRRWARALGSISAPDQTPGPAPSKLPPDDSPSAAPPRPAPRPAVQQRVNPITGRQRGSFLHKR